MLDIDVQTADGLLPAGTREALALQKLGISIDHDVCVGNVRRTAIALDVFSLNGERQLEASNPVDDPEKKGLEAAKTVRSVR